MCDIYIKVGNKEFGAHRFILCATSDVFQVSILVLTDIQILITKSFNKEIF